MGGAAADARVLVERSVSGVRIVVFGASGMVGRAVVASAGAVNAEIVAPTRQGDGLLAESPGDLRPLLRGAQVAVNCIAVLRSDASYGTAEYRRTAILVNALWPHVLCEQAGDVGCRLVQISTDAVFAPAEAPATEDTATDASEPYGMSKALGEVTGNALNIRLSAIGPASDRGAGLWQWVIGQRRNAVVDGHSGFGWSGCTSKQVAQLVVDLLPAENFEIVREKGAIHHFAPNGVATKYEALVCLAERFRPDLTVRPVAQEAPTCRPLVSTVKALESVYTGSRGWRAAIEGVPWPE